MTVRNTPSSGTTAQVRFVESAAAAATTLQAPGRLEPGDLAAYVANLITQRAQRRDVPQSIARILPGPGSAKPTHPLAAVDPARLSGPGSAKPTHPLAAVDPARLSGPGSAKRADDPAEVARRAAFAAATVQRLLAKGFVTEPELAHLNAARHLLLAILDMRNAGAMTMCHLPVQRRLNEQLFSPVKELYDLATRTSSALIAKIVDRDSAAIGARLDDAQTDAYRPFDPAAVAREKRSLNGVDAYRPNDLVCVSRSGGDKSLGVVVGRDPEGLVVAVNSGGRIGFHIVNEAELVANNPLPIGTYIKTATGQEFWVTRTLTQGEPQVVAKEPGQPAQAIPAANVRVLLDAMTRAVDSARTPKPPAALATQPPGVLHGDEARAQVTGASGTAAAYTGKGLRSANEDAVLVQNFDGKVKFLALAVADEAGGHTKIPNVLTSQLVLEQIRVDAGPVSNGTAEARRTLETAIHTANDRILALNKTHKKNAATTVATAFLFAPKDPTSSEPRKALVAVAGDSLAMHFSAAGNFVHETTPHTIGARYAEQDAGHPSPRARTELLEASIPNNALGMKRLRVDIEEWRLGKGDFLVLVTDGATSGNMEAEKAEFQRGTPKEQIRAHEAVTRAEIAEILKRAKTCADAAEQIKSLAISKMKNASPEDWNDNVSVVVARAS